MTNQQAISSEDRLFIGIFPTGISYADRSRQKFGDYARLAFLPFATLELTVEEDCPPDLRSQIDDHAKTIQAKRGEQFQVSTCAQFVTLGGSPKISNPIRMRNG